MGSAIIFITLQQKHFRILRWWRWDDSFIHAIFFLCLVWHFKLKGITTCMKHNHIKFYSRFYRNFKLNWRKFWEDIFSVKNIAALQINIFSIHDRFVNKKCFWALHLKSHQKLPPPVFNHLIRTSCLHQVYTKHYTTIHIQNRWWLMISMMMMMT